MYFKFNKQINKGVIVDLSIFSDCLNTDFIEILNMRLKSLKEMFNYNQLGIKSIFDILLCDKEISENENYKKYVEEMSVIFPDQV